MNSSAHIVAILHKKEPKNRAFCAKPDCAKVFLVPEVISLFLAMAARIYLSFRIAAARRPWSNCGRSYSRAGGRRGGGGVSTERGMIIP
jgi:hypothetical protein